jgi:hypothetical protein
MKNKSDWLVTKARRAMIERSERDTIVFAPICLSIAANGRVKRQKQEETHCLAANTSNDGKGERVL